MESCACCCRHEHGDGEESVLVERTYRPFTVSEQRPTLGLTKLTVEASLPMNKPLFEFDLKRVSRENYITGKAASNFPHPGSTTGGWHFLSYFDRESGVAKVSLAGIHYPETTVYFGDLGIIDLTDELAKRGWSVEERQLYMADHYRAAADMIVRWALSESNHCSVEIDDWFPSPAERERLLEILDTGRSKLYEVGRLQKVEAWLRTLTSG
jgi:hypothetical protein